jgi:hypothetical protein
LGKNEDEEKRGHERTLPTCFDSTIDKLRFLQHFLR